MFCRVQILDASILTRCNLAFPDRPRSCRQAEGRWRRQAHWVPMTDQDGTPRLLCARVCCPEGDAPARAAVLNHGTAALRKRVAGRQAGKGSQGRGAPT